MIAKARMRVFISHRAIEPDLTIARRFSSALSQSGHEPFVATDTVHWGGDWARIIDEELDACDCFLLLLSNEAAHSSAVIVEVNRVCKRSKPPLVLILKVNLTVWPRFDLDILIHPYQFLEWRYDADTQTAIYRLLAMLTDSKQPPSKPGPKVGDSLRNPKDGLIHMYIPPGIFRMGCSEGDKECSEDEKPVRQITLSKGFWLGQTPVTVVATGDIRRRQARRCRNPRR